MVEHSLEDPSEHLPRLQEAPCSVSGRAWKRWAGRAHGTQAMFQEAGAVGIIELSLACLKAGPAGSLDGKAAPLSSPAPKRARGCPFYLGDQTAEG